MAADSSLIVISNRWDLKCDEGVQSSWQQDCQRQWWLHWIWPKSPRLPFTLSRNEEGVLIRKAAAGELLDHKSTWLRGQGDGGIDWGSTSVSRLMKIYWAPNQTKSRIGNTPWKDCESAIRSNFIWTIFRESSLKGGVLDLLEKITNHFFFYPLQCSEYLMNTLSGGLVTAVAPVVIQVGFTTKMIQTDMAISRDIEKNC